MGGGRYLSLPGYRFTTGRAAACNTLSRIWGSAGNLLLFFRPACQSSPPPHRLPLSPPAGERLPGRLGRQEVPTYASVQPIWAHARYNRSHRRFFRTLALAIECAWPDPLFGSACLATLCRCRIGQYEFRVSRRPHDRLLRSRRVPLRPGLRPGDTVPRAGGASFNVVREVLTGSWRQDKRLLLFHDPSLVRSLICGGLTA